MEPDWSLEGSRFFLDQSEMRLNSVKKQKRAKFEIKYCVAKVYPVLIYESYYFGWDILFSLFHLTIGPSLLLYL